MKNKIAKFGGMMLAAMMGVTSCLNSGGETAYDQVKPVAPGINIYNAANSQNAASMQPADIALKLAVLRAEALKQGKMDDWNSVVNENSISVKNLLFGFTTQIAEDEQEPGTYEIRYANAGGQWPYDSYRRQGTIRVRTQGVALEETDENKMWTVSLGSSQFTVTGGRTVTLLSTGETSIYWNGEGYQIEFFNGMSYVNEARKASWNGSFVLTPEVTGSLAFSDLEETSFGFEGQAQGTSFWSFNGTTSAQMSYQVTEGLYNPSEAGPTQLIGGTETCTLLSMGDYNIAEYPSPEVKVVWNKVGSKISYSITYNDTTVDF